MSMYEIRDTWYEQYSRTVSPEIYPNVRMVVKRGWFRIERKVEGAWYTDPGAFHRFEVENMIAELIKRPDFTPLTK